MLAILHFSQIQDRHIVASDRHHEGIILQAELFENTAKAQVVPHLFQLRRIRYDNNQTDTLLVLIQQSNTSFLPVFTAKLVLLQFPHKLGTLFQKRIEGI